MTARRKAIIPTLAPHVRNHPLVAAYAHAVDQIAKRGPLFPDNTIEKDRLWHAYDDARAALFRAVPSTPVEGCILAAAMLAVNADDGGAENLGWGDLDIKKWIAHLSAVAYQPAPKQRAA